LLNHLNGKYRCTPKLSGMTTFEKFLLIFAIVILIFSIVPRYYDILKFLPDYSIDENDVVERAVGFLGGDLNPYRYGYGPLYAYILAAIYYLVSFFYPGDVAAFAEDIFFNPTKFYYIARALNSSLNIFLGLSLFFWIQRLFKNKILALICLGIGIFPFLDKLTQFHIRADTLLAVWSFFVLVFCIEVIKKGSLKHYIFMGIFFGLGIATKPLPGLLILPTIVFAHLVRCISEIENPKVLLNKQSLGFYSKLLFKNIFKIATDHRFLLFIFSGYLTNILFNPYSLIAFIPFIKDQYYLATTQGSRNFLPGWVISRFFGPLGIVFTILSVVSVPYIFYKSMKFRKAELFIIASYPIVFWLAFAKGASRNYFYIPIMPFVILCVAFLIVDLSSIVKFIKLRNVVIFIFMILIIFQPGFKLAGISMLRNSDKDFNNLHSNLAAKTWIEQNIPCDTKLLLYGYYVRLPRLVHRNSAKQAVYGEYFMGRKHKKNKYLTELYEKAYSDYRNQGKPVFNLSIIRSRQKETEVDLFDYCLNHKIDYLITCRNLKQYPEFEKRLYKRFTKPQYPCGNNIAIYQMKRSGL
jgi:hypothetical protein